MLEKWTNIEGIIKDIPQDIKDKSQIDEKLKKVKTTKKLKDKEKLLNEVKTDIDNLEQSEGITTIDNWKLKAVEKEITTFQSKLKTLKSKIAWNPKAPKILEITDNLGDNGLFGKDDEWFMWFFREIIKWFENHLNSRFGIEKSASTKKIAKTFEKLWYGKLSIIKKVLPSIETLPLKKLKLDLNKLDLNKLDLKWINTKEEKEVAIKMLETIVMNEKLLKSDSTWWFVAGIENTIKSSVDSELWWTKTDWKPTVWTVINKMFDHWFSDNFRDYALPSKWAKLVNYGNIDIGSEKEKKVIKNIKAKLTSPKIMTFTTIPKELNKSNNNPKWTETLKPKLNGEIQIEWTNIYIKKWGNIYEFESWTGDLITITKDDIKSLSLTNEWLTVTVSWLGTHTKTIKTDLLKEWISEISPTHTTIIVDGKTLKFKIVSKIT